MAPHDSDREILIRLDTKMDLLISDDSTKGMIPELRKDVDEHQDQISFWKGALAILTFLVILLGGTEIWHVLAVGEKVIK